MRGCVSARAGHSSVLWNCCRRIGWERRKEGKQGKGEGREGVREGNKEKVGETGKSISHQGEKVEKSSTGTSGGKEGGREKHVGKEQEGYRHTRTLEK